MDENCYVVEETDRVTIIDPGWGVSSELLPFVGSKQVRILLTHGHADHIFDLDKIISDEIVIHELDRDMLIDPEKSLLNIFGKEVLLLEEAKIWTPEILDGQWKCLHTPGHTEGSCCFLYGEKQLFSGDTVFSNSIGRTDLPGGNEIEMQKSIQQLRRLFNELPCLRVFPGHGPEATAQVILRENPFFR
ncbi:MAG TPA: MBL fold metallo-hydrolase [Mesotoga infera]|uniref:MBL fold metallo-hydrolase n=1 Tax=Mesotoga infera TaxID=1236046 RepID=A0A7C1GSG1_9BACT|nr:MBL fold metallo-hydrolase [Mesotoga infera]